MTEIDEALDDLRDFCYIFIYSNDIKSLKRLVYLDEDFVIKDIR